MTTSYKKALLSLPPEKKEKKKSPLLSFHKALSGSISPSNWAFFFFGVQCSKAFFIIRHEKL